MHRTCIVACLTAVIGFCSNPPGGDVKPLGQAKVIRHTAPINFFRWTDPRENAFSADVPRGWTVTGGLTRISAIDTRPNMQVVSPDGGIRATLGDQRLALAVIPSPALAAAGYRDGSMLPNGTGFTPVRSFMPGVTFAEQYVRAQAAAGCLQINIVGRRDRPDLAQSLNRFYAQMFGNLTMGEVAFTCLQNSRPMRGYYFAGVLRTQLNNGLGFWAVLYLYGFIAPESDRALGEVALHRLVTTYRTNENWAMRQGQTTMAASRAMAQSNEEISRMISESYWNRSRSLDETFRQGANARRGTTDVVDPDTGETWNIWTDTNARYYWHLPGSDVIVGTPTYEPPAVGYTPVREY